MSYKNPTGLSTGSSLSTIISQQFGKGPNREEAQKKARTTANIASLAQGVLSSITPKKVALKDFTAT